MTLSTSSVKTTGSRWASLKTWEKLLDFFKFMCLKSRFSFIVEHFLLVSRRTFVNLDQLVKHRSKPWKFFHPIMFKDT